jgi:hypothetical protein
MPDPTATSQRAPAPPAHPVYGAAIRHRRSAAARLCIDFEARRELSWDALAAWPRWALPVELGGPREKLDHMALRVGAHRYIAALRACIDGMLLQTASRLLGEEALEQLLQAPAIDGSCATLPSVDALEAVWRDNGRAMLLTRIDDPVLREAVAHSLQWPLAQNDLDASPPQGPQT